MTEDGIASLRRAGFSLESAISAVRIVSRFVVGFALIEIGLTGERPPPPADASALADLLEAVATDDPDDLFDFGLETMIDGLAARLRRE